MNDIATRDDIASLGQTVEAMTAAVNAQTDVMRSLAEAMSRQNVESARATGGRAEVTVNAGGMALWLAVTVAGMMAVANACLLVGGALWLGRIDRENSEHGHQLNAIYMIAPHLKPAPEEPKQ